MRNNKRKTSNTEYAFLGMGIFLLVILLATFALAPRQKNRKSSFSFKIKDPQIFIAKAGGKLPLELEKNLYFSLMKSDEASIIWEVDGGSIENMGSQAIWNLPKRDGDYTVSVYRKNKNLKQGRDDLSVKVAIDPDLAVPRPVVVTEYPKKEITEDLDTDQDGLTDLEERKKRSNPTKMDTDSDGLSDGYEVNKLKTNPLLKDTDRDGILDGYEDAFHENPLKRTSKKNYSAKIQDRTKKAAIDIEGSPESVYHLFIESLENDLWTGTYDMVTPIYKITSKGVFTSAKLSIKYDQKKLDQLKLREEDLTICEIDLIGGEITILPSEVDLVGNIVKAIIKKFTLYSVISKHSIKTNLLFDLIFVIDDSGSMIEPSPGFTNTGSDPSNFRLEVAEKICYTFLKADNRFGVVQFSSEAKVIQNLTDDKNLIEQALMDLNWHSEGSTNIGEGILSAIESFDQSPKQKIIILLSDGMDTSDTNGTIIRSALKQAIQSNITIYTIGLGDGVNKNELQQIASQTKGRYFYAENIREIDQFFLQIQSAIQIVNELDGVLLDHTLWRFLKRIDLSKFIDKGPRQKKIGKENQNLYGVLVGESGFTMPDDSLPFNNGTLSTTGVCFGMAAICTEKYNQTFSPYLTMDEVPLIDWTPDSDMKAIKRGDSYFAPGYKLQNISPFNSKQPLNTFQYDILRKVIQTKTDEFGNIIKKNGVVLLEHEEELKELGFAIDKKEDEKGTKIQYCNGLDINIVNQPDTKWNNKEKELVNGIFRLFYEQAGFQGPNPDHLYKRLLVDDIGELREILQKQKAVIVEIFGKDNTNNIIGHAVVLKNIYSVVSLDNTKQDGSPLYCFYIYDNNYPNEVMPLLIKYQKIRDHNGNFGYNPELYVFGSYEAYNFKTIEYAIKRR